MPFFTAILLLIWLIKYKCKQAKKKNTGHRRHQYGRTHARSQKGLNVRKQWKRIFYQRAEKLAVSFLFCHLSLSSAMLALFSLPNAPCSMIKYHGNHHTRDIQNRLQRPSSYITRAHTYLEVDLVWIMWPRLPPFPRSNDDLLPKWQFLSIYRPHALSLCLCLSCSGIVVISLCPSVFFTDWLFCTNLSSFFYLFFVSK